MVFFLCIYVMVMEVLSFLEKVMLMCLLMGRDWRILDMIFSLFVGGVLFFVGLD